MLLDTSNTSFAQFLHKIVESNLLQPALELDQRSKKCLRSELVQIGYQILTGSNRSIESTRFLGQLVESLHTGSLIIDDIQDNSSVRRNGPCVHLQYGVPLSINAGNWLYFSALHQIESTPHLSDRQKLLVYKSISRVMYWAHVGQAIDLGAKLNELTSAEVIQVCEKSLLMKSGYLTGLSFELAAIAADADQPKQKLLFEHGCKFGVLLQKFDDVGNLKINGNSPKNLEDLILLRPSWIWSCAHADLTPIELESFKSAVNRLPDTRSLDEFLNKFGLRHRAYQKASAELESWLLDVAADFKLTDQCEVLKNLNNIGMKLKNAYT